MTPVVVAAGAVPALVYIGFAVVQLRRALGRTPAGVVKALRRKAGEHHVTVPRWPVGSRTWNPAAPLGQNNGIFEPGTGVYRLDGDLVELQWTPKAGEPQQLAGPVPSEFRAGSTRHQHVARVKRLVLGGYLAVLVIGFGLGFGLSSGAASGRIGWGLAGIAIGMFLVWAGLWTFLTVRGTRRALQTGRRERESR